MNVQNYNINVRVGTGITQNVKLSQGDIGRELVFFLYDGAVRFSPPSGATVKIKGTKPSGLGFDVACTLSGSVARASTTLAMTQEGGNIPAELEISNGSNVIGTANFVLHVEPSPHPAGTTDGTTEEARTVLAQCAQYAQEAQEAAAAASGDYTEIRSDVDDLSADVSAIKADLDDLDDRVTALEEGGGSGLTDAVKTALLAIFQKVAYVDDDGESYYDDLYDALYPPADLVSISAVYTQSGTVYDTDTLDSLKSDLVVTALMSDSTTQTVTNYTLSGTLTEGTSTITVNYGGKTATFSVTVTVFSTAPRIAEYDKGYASDGTAGSKTNACITEVYGPYTLDIDTVKQTQCYDTENDYMTQSGHIFRIKYYINSPNALSSSYRGTRIRDKSGTKIEVPTPRVNTEYTLTDTRYITTYFNLTDNEIDISFTLDSDGLADSYAYWEKTAENVLPVGVNDGDIIFAGSNTAYYNKRNIYD